MTQNQRIPIHFERSFTILQLITFLLAVIMVVDMTGEGVVAATRKKCTADKYHPETIPCMIEGKVKILFVDTSISHDYIRSIHVIASHLYHESNMKV